MLMNEVQHLGDILEHPALSHFEALCSFHPAGRRCFNYFPSMRIALIFYPLAVVFFRIFNA